MPLPKAIQQAAADADAQVAALMELESQPLVVDPATGEPNPPAGAQPAALPAPAAPATDEFEQKYKTLQGKYDAEVPVLRAQVSNYERINQTLSAQVATLSEQVQSLSQAVAQKAEPVPQELVTSRDVEQYGSDLIDLINRVADARTAAAVAAVRDEVRQATSAVSQDVAGVKRNQQQTDRALYEQRLTEAVPDWRAINVDPAWLQWLSQFDPILGATRQDALNIAYRNFDAPRTVAFLQTFLATHTPQTAALTPQEELARQVTPSTTSSPAVTTPPADTRSAKVWTQEEIGVVYKEVLQGKWKHNPEGKAALLKEIDQAVAEGRVR